MNKLIKEKAKLRKMMILKDLNSLEHEEILATIWSYRNMKNGCHYSNEQWSNLLYCGERKIKSLLKDIRESGLVISKRKYNNATQYFPSDEMKGILRPSERQNTPTGGAYIAPYTSSKEEEDTKPNSESGFIPPPHLEKKYLEYLSLYGKDYAETMIKKAV
jgi:hypothetical protein